MSAALNHLAARVATDPLFLASALAEYSRSEGLDDDGLATALGCLRTDLTRLRLCSVPRPDPEMFHADVLAIAERFGIAPNTLTAVVRRGQSLSRLRAVQTAGVEPGFLLAARDDERKPPPQDEEPTS
jgi:hypothetical protein